MIFINLTVYFMNWIARLLNFIIDSTAYFLLLVGSTFVFGAEVLQNQRYVLILVYFLYYFVCEALFQQTFGKKITGTKVVDYHHHNKPSLVQILIRTVSRIIPFYFISYFMSGKGLHDHFSKTILIKPN